MQIQSEYRQILSRIRAVKRRALRLHCAAELLLTLAAWCCTAVAAVGVEALFHLGTSGRTILLAASVLILAAQFIYIVLPSLLRALGILAQPSDDDVARVIGAKFPAVRDELVNGMQLARASGNESSPNLYHSSNLVEAAFAAIARRVQNIRFTDAVETDELKRSTKTFFASLVLPLAVFTLLSPFQDAAYRLLRFNESFLPPAPFTFIIEPGNAQRVKGDSLAVTIRTPGPTPPTEITVYAKENDEQVFQPSAIQSQNGIFRYAFNPLKRTTEYYATAKNIQSDQYLITVIDRPEIKSLKIKMVYPAYIRSQPVELEENDGDIAGLTGTSAQFEITANKPVAAARIVFVPADTAVDTNSDMSAHITHAKHETQSYASLETNGEKIHGDFVIRKNGTYHIELTDNESVRSVDPIEYHVTALLDEYPTIQVIQPLAVTDITDASKIGVITRVHDDYGFSRLLLHYKLSKSKFANPWKDFKEISVPLALNSLDQEVPYIWDLSQMNLVPEDQVDYYLEVFDNDVVTGPKSAKSDIHTLRLPSLDAVLKESDESQADANQDLQQAAKDAEELHKEMEQTTKELREQAQQKNLSWQEQKKIQDVLKKQEALQQKIDDARQKLDDAMQKLESQQALSPETLQKYMELQKLFQEMKSPEMMDAMKKLQQAMQQMSPDQMRDAMKNFSFNEEDFKKSIERTTQLLKHIQAEQKTEQLIKQAEQLQNQQQQLQQQTQNAQTEQQKQALEQQQKELQKQAEDMEKSAKDLAEEMKELNKDAPQKEMENAQKSLDSAQVPQDMQKAQQQMDQQEMSDAQQNQQKAQQGLQQFQQNMQSVQKKMKENQQREAVNEMRRSLQDMVDLSKREDDIKQKTDATESNSAQLPELAKDQAQALSDMGNVVNRMMKLSQKTFAVTPELGKELGKAMHDMQSAAGSLEQRQSPQAGANEGNAMGDMNGAAMMMQQALSKMQNGNQPGGSSGGNMESFMQQLNDMAGQQEGINGQTQKLGNMNPGSLSMEQQAQLGRLAGQQAAVQQSLEKMQKEQSEMTGGKKNTLGDLNKIADEMQEVIKDMQSGNVSPETIRRQERILSRMLDAQRSQQERDFDKKREGKAGDDATRQSPDELPDTLTRQADAHKDMLRLLEQGYTKDYEERIKKYFEALEKNQTPQ